jgi:hypothetical protein
VVALFAKLIVADEDTEHRGAFFIGHAAFVTPLHVLEMLVRQFNDARMRRDIQVR